MHVLEGDETQKNFQEPDTQAKFLGVQWSGHLGIFKSKGEVIALQLLALKKNQNAQKASLGLRGSLKMNVENTDMTDLSDDGESYQS